MPSDDLQPWETSLESLRAPLYRRDRVTTAARVVLEHLVELEAKGQVPEADTLRGAFVAHLAESQRQVPAGQQERWQVLEAVADGEVAMPADLRRQVARWLIDDDGHLARLAARRVHQASPAEGRRLALALRGRAPALARALDDELDPPQLAPEASPLRRWKLGLLAATALPGAWMLWSNLAPSPPGASPLSYDHRVSRAREAAIRGAQVTRESGSDELSLRALRVVDALEARHCAEAQHESGLLGAQLTRLDPERNTRLEPLHVVVDYARELCPLAR